MFFCRVATVLLSLAVLTAAVTANTAKSQPVEILSSYIEAIRAEKWPEAEALWDGDNLRHCGRLGIIYENTPAQYDCASALLRVLPQIRADEVGLAIQTVLQSDSIARLQVVITHRADTILQDYCLQNIDNRWQLISPLYALTGDWAMVETDYLRIFYTDSSRVFDSLLRLADKALRDLGDSLGLRPDELALLEREKFDYFLCDDSTMLYLTGHYARGMVDYPTGAMVSRELPHYHEMVHALANFKMKSRPLYSLPFIQEGLACWLGGRWNKAPRIIRYEANIALTYDLAAVDDVLAYNDFDYRIGNADISYPISTMLTGYLLDQIGLERFFQVYRDVSGKARDLRKLTKTQIQELLVQATGQTWPEIEAGAREMAARYPDGGIRPISYTNGSKPFESSIDVEDFAFSFTAQAGRMDFEVALPDAVSGYLIVIPGNADTQGYNSTIFAERYSDIPYKGWRYGLEVSRTEIGLYDFHRNTLMAKYIPGLLDDEQWLDPPRDRIGGIINVSELDFKIWSDQANNLEFYSIP